MNENTDTLEGMDISILKLFPRNERNVSQKYMKRIAASMEAVGLIDPLMVFPVEDKFEILDGCVRYRILLEWGEETVPCLIAKEREAFTGNRMVNRLTAGQEMRMLRKSLDELDEKTIADALGMSGISHRINKGLIEKLSPDVVKAFEAGKLNLQSARELANVKLDRQAEILRLMASCNDYSITFTRGLILKTPISKRAKRTGQPHPWSKAKENKQDLLKKLHEAEQQQDFYSSLYRQYTTNLLKLVIFVRSLVSNDRIRDHLQDRHPQEMAVLEEILDNTEK